MDESVIQRIQAARTAAASDVDKLKAQVDRAERWRKLLDAVSESADAQPAMTATALARAQDLIKDHETTDSDTVEALRDLWQDCQQRARQAAAESVRTFADAAEAAGLRIDSSSRHPRYSFDEHAIEVELQERDLVAKIDIRHGERIKEPLDIPAVVTRLRAEHERLFERPWKSDAFLKQLRAAYKKHKSPSDGVPLRDLAATMAGKGKKPRLDEFAVDLGRLLRDRDVMATSIKMTTNQTRDTARGLLLHGLEHGGYVLSISIEEST